MKTLQSEFEERLSEVDTYFELLASIEEATRQVGSPRFVGAMDPISAAQQRILYSCVFLQLYNLVESTVTSCFGALAEALRTSGRWRPRDLSEPLQREWVRFTARTHENDLAPDNRLESALHLFSQLVEESPIDRFEVERGGGGSWDDSKIERLGKRLGICLSVSQPVFEGIKRPFRDDDGPLVTIKRLRNDLAHGSISFAQCADDLDLRRLRELKKLTCDYLKEIVACFERFLLQREFLSPVSRPSRFEGDEIAL